MRRRVGADSELSKKIKCGAVTSTDALQISKVTDLGISIDKTHPYQNTHPNVSFLASHNLSCVS